jgi:hypothetical protein
MDGTPSSIRSLHPLRLARSCGQAFDAPALFFGPCPFSINSAGEIVGLYINRFGIIRPVLNICWRTTPPRRGHRTSRFPQAAGHDLLCRTRALNQDVTGPLDYLTRKLPHSKDLTGRRTVVHRPNQYSVLPIDFNHPARVIHRRQVTHYGAGGSRDYVSRVSDKNVPAIV